MPEVKFHHRRVCDKKKFDQRSFRVKAFGKRGIKATIGCPTGKWDPTKKRCKIGTVVQNILFPKDKFTLGQADSWMRKYEMTQCPTHRFK